MIENESDKLLSSIPNDGKCGTDLNIVTFLNQSKFMLQDITPEHDIPATKVVNTEKFQNQRSIYVCTFCQVFSSSDTAITDHIAEVHYNSIPIGVTAENFVSKLQALQNKKQTHCPKKVGRPRKVPQERTIAIEENIPIPEPIPRSDGLYWCEKCLRYFTKARQLTRHICFEVEEEDEFDESSIDSDAASDYQIYMDVQPYPWIRRVKNRSKPLDLCENGSSILPEDQQNKVKLNWRNDPEYIPLFQNEQERIAFEEHLKSIDYSCVDNLFVKEEKKLKARRKKACLPGSISTYSCILCKKVLNSLTHMRMHCLTHTDVKPFTCPKCPYRSNTKGSLYTHMRNHTGNVFRCSQCSFQSVKRTHLLDHEETHSSNVRVCKLCKNSYKTVKSLIAHIRRYHNYPGGIKYAKSLSSKQPKESTFQCKVCQKRFKSVTSLEAHNKREHIIPTTLQIENLAEGEEIIQDGASENLLVDESEAIPSSKSEDIFQNKILSIDDPLATIVLNDLLQQKNSEPIELYEDVFQESLNTKLLSPSGALADSFSSNSTSQRLSPLNVVSQFHSPKNSLEECDKTLNLDILDECLRNSDFVDEVMGEANIDASKLPIECDQPFDLPASMQLAYSNESLITSNIVENNETPDLVDKNDLTEPKSAEIKLFEKCRRAPAYVCCVCSGIFICTATLKAHLKEHVNTSSSLMDSAEEEFEQPKMTEADAAIDSVCRILQDPMDVCTDNERELEKLYTSSLDTIWYLPEVSVVLENDPALWNTLLEDISNLTYNAPDDLQVKCPGMFD